jgi:hypothetical protein
MSSWTAPHQCARVQRGWCSAHQLLAPAVEASQLKVTVVAPTVSAISVRGWDRLRSTFSGVVKSSQGRHAEAEVDMRRALLSRFKSVSKYHIDTAAVRNQFSWLLLEQARVKEGEVLARASLDIISVTAKQRRWFDLDAGPFEHPPDNVGGVEALCRRPRTARGFRWGSRVDPSALRAPVLQ